MVKFQADVTFTGTNGKYYFPFWSLNKISWMKYFLGTTTILSNATTVDESSESTCIDADEDVGGIKLTAA